MHKITSLRALLPFFIFGLTGCHTLMEGGSSSSYEKTTNSQGETVYRRTETVTPVYLAPPDPPNLAPSKIALYGQPGTEIAPAATVTTAASRGFGQLELAVTDGYGHLGGQLGYFFADWFAPRIGLAAFFARDAYLGGDLAARFIWPSGDLKPFVGLGGYLGDMKRCENQVNSFTGRYEEVCEKKFLGAGYLEAGLEFRNFSIFVRDYRVTRAGLNVPTKLFFGLGLRF